MRNVPVEATEAITPLVIWRKELRQDSGDRRERLPGSNCFRQCGFESTHHLKGEFTSVITGFLGEPARVSNPRVPAAGQGGDLTFTMKVDPSLRNYLTVKFSGEESSSGYTSMVNINGEQVGFFAYGDTEAINKGWTLPNRFYYNTILLPLE